MPPNPWPPFEVMMSIAVRDRIRHLRKLALLRGVFGSFGNDIRYIERHLRSVPLIWGEASYQLRQLELIICVGFRNRLLVRYGVRTSRPEVWLRALIPLNGHSLFPPD